MGLKSAAISAKCRGGDKTPIVIITDVYKGKRYRLDAIKKYGATEYIEKPIEDANLLSILQNLIRKATELRYGYPITRSAAEEEDNERYQFSAEDIDAGDDSLNWQSPTNNYSRSKSNSNSANSCAAKKSLKSSELKSDDDIDVNLKNHLLV